MEEKAMVSTAELGPLISELKSIMQKKGYSPASIIDLEKVWMSLGILPATACPSVTSLR